MKRIVVSVSGGIFFGTLLSVIFCAVYFVSFQRKQPKHQVVIDVNINTNKPIKKITIKSENSEQTVERLIGYKEIQFVFPVGGEDVYKISVEFENGQKLTIEEYVESGYHQVLELNSKEIKII